MITLQGQLRYGWLGKAKPEREPASFVLFVPGKRGLKVVAQDGSPAAPDVDFSRAGCVSKMSLGWRCDILPAPQRHLQFSHALPVGTPVNQAA